MRTPTALLLLAAACGDPGGETTDPQEVISRVVLTFEPTNSNPRSFTWDDPDGDGGAAPTIDPIALDGGSHTVRVQFFNALEDPAEDITVEVEDEGVEHLVLYTTDAPLTFAYADQDANGLPLGLQMTADATANGQGTLTVVLRHMPPEEPPQKSATSADDFAAGRPIGGSTDVSVEFPVTVQVSGDAPPT